MEAFTQDPKQSALVAGLRYISDDAPGIIRKRKGDGFVYYDVDGRIVRSSSELNRIRSLAIPPAWKNVWIRNRANGHLQATGIDERGRKQYKYHPDWRAIRDEVICTGKQVVWLDDTAESSRRGRGFERDLSISRQKRKET